MAINSSVCLHFFTFALMTGQNVGKVISELKLVADNLNSSSFSIQFT